MNNFILKFSLLAFGTIKVPKTSRLFVFRKDVNHNAEKTYYSSISVALASKKKTTAILFLYWNVP